MKKLLGLFGGVMSLFASSMVSAMDLPGEFSGELSFEVRNYLGKGAYGNNEKEDLSIVLQPEYVVAWEEGRKVVSFEPFMRFSSLDDKRSHGDIRELSFVGSWDLFELRVGISKVFWGVTESQHLVDVINQTDLVESPDGEDKLGQPMINLVYVSDYGNFECFLLPYFRERTFSGIDGRLRTNLTVDQDHPVYLHGDEERHMDYAIRWSHYQGGFDWALSYFEGTNREPELKANSRATMLVPTYYQSKQASAELQYVFGDWLLKAEGISRNSALNESYWASVLGFEYTFTNYHKGMDIGLLYEYLYDERGEKSGSGLNDASFVGTRIALNDEKSLQFLLGGIFDHQNGKASNAFLESSRRIDENWKWSLEGVLFANPSTGSFLDLVKRDDYLQARVSYFW